MKKKPLRTLLPSDKKRNCIIAAKVTEEQRKHIQKKAEEAGMTISDFVLASCYNYKLYGRLSEDDCKLLKNLDNCRADLLNYTSALHGMDQSKRKEMFNQYSFMLGWLKELGLLAKRLEQFLEDVRRKNKVQAGTSK